MDPIERVLIDKDTTFALMLEAQARGHEVFSLGPSDLMAAEGTVYARLSPTRVDRVAPPAHATVGPAVLTDLRSVDAVVAELPNAVAFRTLSKAWGLAGLRVGYAVGPVAAIGALRVAGNPYSVSGPSLFLAEARVTDDADASEAYIAQVRADRDELTEGLRGLGLDAQRSQANFVFARTPRAAWVAVGAGMGTGAPSRILPFSAS
jgi:histidinol-phosphate aminotransferase